MMPMKLDQPDPPVYHSPFDSRAKLMNLQNLAQQQQIGQQQLQAGQMSIEDQQRQIAQRKAIDQAYRDAFTVGDDGTPQLDEGKLTKALALGNHGSAIPGILEGQTKYKKSLADLADTRSKAAALEQDAVGHLAASVQAGNNDPHLFLTGMTQGVHSGAVTAAHVKPMMDQVTAALDQDPTGETARALVGQITNQMIAGSPKERELATQRRTSDATVLRDTAQAGAADATALQKNWELTANNMPMPDPQTGTIDPQAWSEWRAGAPPAVQAKIPPQPSPVAIAWVKRQGLTMEQQRQAEQAQATLEETKKRDQANMGNSETELAVIATNPNETPERRKAAGDALRRLDQSKQASRPVINNLIPGVPTGPATGAAAELHGEEFLKTLPPAIAARIRQMGSGDITAPTGRAATTGAGGQIMNALMQYDPTFNERRAAIRKAFTTGPDGRNIGNLNTAPVHLDQLYDAAMAMKNGSFQPGNKIYNSLREIFGSSMPTNVDALRVTVAGEMANALKGVATDPEIAHINETLNRAKSPEQIAGVIEEDLQSIAGKLNTYHERAQQQDVGKWSPVLPSARAVFQRHGIDPDTLKKTGGGVGGGGGGQAAAPKKDDTKQYQGHTYKFDGSKWVRQ